MPGEASPGLVTDHPGRSQLQDPRPADEPEGEPYHQGRTCGGDVRPLPVLRRREPGVSVGVSRPFRVRGPDR
jgi:hypothetical protein